MNKKYLGIWDIKTYGEFNKEKIAELLLEQNLKIIRVLNYLDRYFIDMEMIK